MPASKVAEASWILLLSLADVVDRLTASWPPSTCVNMDLVEKKRSKTW